MKNWKEEWRNDPGNKRYYADVELARQQMRAELEPALFRITYVGFIVGGWTMIWYWGKNETGFASGRTIEAAIEHAERLVFRGL